MESELYFFEFKQRDKKEIQKYRYATASNEHGVMNEHGKEFFEGMFHSLYGHEFSGSI